MRDYVRLNFSGISQETIEAGDRMLDLLNDEEEMKKYRVVLKSKSGIYPQYKARLEVSTKNEADAIEVAHENLKQTYPDRNRAMWEVVTVKCIGQES